MTEHTYVLHPGKDTTTLAQRVQLFLSQAENILRLPLLLKNLLLLRRCL